MNKYRRSRDYRTAQGKFRGLVLGFVVVGACITSTGTAAADTVTETISVGGFPKAVAVSPNGSYAYVTSQNGSVSVIDTATNTVTGTIDVGRGPHAVAFNPNGSYAYVTSQNGSVSVIDTATNTVTETVSVGAYPEGIAVNPNGS
ncbi:YncE family protein, partial [Rhodococcus marinonascens]|uniref:YncE family protein n=1 Tax=Rhodococcus marinonascens TaxID=38311 RepID=UPI000ACFA532